MALHPAPSTLFLAVKLVPVPRAATRQRCREIDCSIRLEIAVDVISFNRGASWWQSRADGAGDRFRARRGCRPCNGLRVVLVGTTGSKLTPERAGISTLIDVNGRKLLFDAGCGALQNFYLSRIHPTR
jgi:hypothetical protein